MEKAERMEALVKGLAIRESFAAETAAIVVMDAQQPVMAV